MNSDLNMLIDFTAGIICGVMCARCYYLTKAARRRRNQWLPRRLIKLNRL
jgi:hypothetical protein